MCFAFKKNNKQTKKPVNHFLQDDASAGGARGKFVSGAKVLAIVPSSSQPRRVYEDRLETGGAGKKLSTNNEIRSFERVVFWNANDE